MASSKKGPELERFRGDTKAHVFTVTDSDGIAVDISSWTNFLLTVNSDFDPANTDNELLQMTGAFQTDGTDGKVEFSPSLGDSDQTPGSYWYDVQGTDASSKIVTLAKNKYTFHQDIGK